MVINKMENMWESIYVVGGFTGEEFLLLFTALICLYMFLYFEKVKFKFGLITKVGFIGYIAFLATILYKGRMESYELENILISGEKVRLLEGELIKTQIITTYDPYIGENISISDVDIFRPSPTRHSIKTGCWSDYISNSRVILKGDILRIYYILLYEKGPEGVIDGIRKNLDVPCILKVEKKKNK